VILDGGLATELEAKGSDLSDELWSARLLLDEPHLIEEVHREYLVAGADCLISASYQATFEGFVARGMDRREAAELISRAVALACRARNEFWATPRHRQRRRRPLVAASVGPYGAYLADGSEFRGDYGLSVAELENFHRDRWRLLAASGADLLACETLPSILEARALRRLLGTTPRVSAWFSFSCADAEHLHDGTPIEQVARELDDCAQIVAVGINCTPPEYLDGLLECLRRSTSKPAIVYPNSGESWDGARRLWRPGSAAVSWVSRAVGWVDRGARVLGGCCRTRPVEIAALRRTLLD
jgi:homocysteine S-methyltransferase